MYDKTHKIIGELLRIWNYPGIQSIWSAIIASSIPSTSYAVNAFASLMKQLEEDHKMHGKALWSAWVEHLKESNLPDPLCLVHGKPGQSWWLFYRSSGEEWNGYQWHDIRASFERHAYNAPDFELVDQELTQVLDRMLKDG